MFDQLRLLKIAYLVPWETDFARLLMHFFSFAGMPAKISTTMMGTSCWLTMMIMMMMKMKKIQAP
jgi:hypothetical protein